MKNSHRSSPGTEHREAVVLEHQAWVRWQISRLVSDPQVVDDLAQEVFVAWFQFEEQGPEPEAANGLDSSRAWLQRVARNKAIDWLRKSSRQAVSAGNMNEIADRDSAEQFCDPTGDTGTFGSATRLAALRHCLDLLQPEHREIVDEFYRQGKSSELIAARLGRGSNGVRMMLTRIRRGLGKCIRRQIEKKK